MNLDVIKRIGATILITLFLVFIPQSGYSSIYKNKVSQVTSIGLPPVGMNYAMRRLSTSQGLTSFQLSTEKYKLWPSPTIYFDSFYNSAPQWQDNITIPMDKLAEDSELNDGESISYLLSKTTPWRDADRSATKGIAIINSNIQHGKMEYTTDSGLNWQEISNVSENNALLLDAQEYTRIRFVADADYSGGDTGSIEIKAWDGTEGTAGFFFNIQNMGATSAFSVATAIIMSPNIIPADDAPNLLTLPDQLLYENSKLENIEIPIYDIDTSTSNLFISCISSNIDLIKTSTINCKLEENHITLQIKPILGKTGDTEITVTVGDGNSNTATAFKVSVVPASERMPLQVYDDKDRIINETFVLMEAEDHLKIIGGSGNYEIETISQPNGGNINFEKIDDHSFKVAVSHKGAFAGDYKVAIHDKKHGDLKRLNFHVPLSIETKNSSYLLDQQGFLIIRGGEPGEEVKLDIARLEQGRGKPFVINIQTSAVSELDEQNGNPATVPFKISVLNEFIDFRVKAKRNEILSPLSDLSKVIHAVPSDKYCGYVYDDTKNIPIGGSELLINSKVITTTNDDGSFNFDMPRLALGEHFIIVRARGYEPKRYSAKSFINESCAGKVSLTPGNHTFRGILSGLENGESAAIYIYYIEEGRQHSIGPYLINEAGGDIEFELSAKSNREYSSMVFFSKNHSSKVINLNEEGTSTKNGHFFNSKISLNKSNSYTLKPINDSKYFQEALFISGGDGDLCGDVFSAVNVKNNQESNARSCADDGLYVSPTPLSAYQFFLLSGEGAFKFAGRYDSRIVNQGDNFNIEEKNVNHLVDVVLDFKGKSSNTDLHLDGVETQPNETGGEGHFYEMITKSSHLDSASSETFSYDVNVYDAKDSTPPQLEKVNTDDYVSLNLTLKIDSEKIAANDFSNSKASIIEAGDIASLENGKKTTLSSDRIEYLDIYGEEIKLDIKGDSAFSIKTNAPPMAFDMRATMLDSGGYTSHLVGKDDGSNMKFGLVKGKGPTGGSISLNENTGEFTYEKSLQNTGEDSFQFYVYDGDKYSNFATVYLSFGRQRDADGSTRRGSGGAISILLLLALLIYKTRKDYKLIL